MPVGYEELARGFVPMRNSKIFWMINDNYNIGTPPSTYLLLLFHP